MWRGFVVVNDGADDRRGEVLARPLDRFIEKSVVVDGRIGRQAKNDFQRPYCILARRLDSGAIHQRLGLTCHGCGCSVSMQDAIKPDTGRVNVSTWCGSQLGQYFAVVMPCCHLNDGLAGQLLDA